MSRDKKKQYKFLHLKKNAFELQCNGMFLWMNFVDFLTWKYNEKRHGGEQEKVSKIEIKDQYK